MAKQYHVIGLMSGTSLDGLDMAYCVFNEKNGKWAFSIKQAAMVNYDKKWLRKLQNAHNISGSELLLIHNEYGHYLGEQVADFIKGKGIKKLDFIASHGHTIFHQPEKKLTFQLGNGAALAAACRHTVINDFRSLDIALNGQGAPLVPIGDKMLFSEYEYCINLGGFANISYDKKGKRIAFDIGPVNMVLNYLAELLGKHYDKDGILAAKGKLDKNLLDKLNALGYYKQSPPKSLGREWVEDKFLPIINKSSISVEVKLATVTEHIAEQIARTIKNQAKGNVLVTGGGAYNKYLMKQLKAKLPGHKIVIPNDDIIKYKEALVFAFLGVLRLEGKDNCLSSVTGADRNNKGGTIWSL
ncbi:MAG TPA: anhydro-N-acetylmuramic acid kinase [Bacteroidia bacterium]|nr:anhydro-N-acetylmuramic acid kinase [Bacteroidia bacterium]